LRRVSSDPASKEGLTPAAGSLTWHRLDSTASTIHEGADEAPPTYESVTDDVSSKRDQKSSDSKP